MNESQWNFILLFNFKKRGSGYFCSFVGGVWIIYEDGTERQIFNQWYSDEDIAAL